MASPTPSYGVDGLPGENSSKIEPTQSREEENPTASHALADESIQAEPEAKGASQVPHDEIEVRDLGWNSQAANVPQPVVGGLPNEELWTLVRRFDKQMFHVKSIDDPPLANLDMNIADDEDFSPDKLRAQLERLYMTIVIGLVCFWKHIARLRSWGETRRTATFLAVYAVAWLVDLLIPTLTAFLMVLILYPRARTICFPPAPPALIDAKTGGIQKPRAGVLASQDTMMGAPEKHKGEGLEQEAHNFVKSITAVGGATLAVGSSGGRRQDAREGGSDTPDPSEIVNHVSDAMDRTNGDETNAAIDQTKKPVSDSVWNKARPTMHLIADAVDTWERISNALSPTPPFPQREPRFVLAGCLAPLLLGSCLVTSYMVVKGFGFIIGFTFFGDPILTPVIAFLNRTYPRWQKYVELRHSILRGVPTNAQLTVTLLRIGERNKAPVPPPPRTEEPPPVETNANAEDLDYLGATDDEIRDAIEPSTGSSSDGEHEEKKKPNKARRLINLVKGTAKGGVEAALTADKAKAAAGARHARERLGVVKQNVPDESTGPVRFPARYKGKKGYAYVTATATAPALSWTSNIRDVNPAWTVPIAEIDELKKVGGLGWKTKIVVGWALDKQIVDGLVVKTKQGEEHHLTAVVVRDELFNRLIAMGNQMWEVW
ncbi:hypothetical protein HIM_01174 [Hirsutella minnesotensis 3608]|nr:hypothetical protein HIM_01174 [Hirsutella minnesotensis 3608]